MEGDAVLSDDSRVKGPLTLCQPIALALSSRIECVRLAAMWRLLSRRPVSQRPA